MNQNPVEQLVALIGQVCGLNENWAKTCIYYCTATHELNLIDWMPALQILAPPGSGKSQLIKVLSHLAYQPYAFSCYDRMTSVTLRNMLEKAKSKTAIIEEADLYPNRTELERYLINRASTITSVLPYTHQVKDSTGTTQWITDRVFIPGATILHDRHGLDDMAAERRVITVEIRKQKCKIFLKPDEGQLQKLALPKLGLGLLPDTFSAPEVTGSGLDTWEPLVRCASFQQDEEWLSWVWGEVAQFNERLADGQQYELNLTAFKAVIRCLMENNGMLLVKDPIALKDITKIVKEEYPWVKEKSVGTVLRKEGFNELRNIGGTTKLITTDDQLRRIANDIGYKDDSLTGLP